MPRLPASHASELSAREANAAAQTERAVGSEAFRSTSPGHGTPPLRGRESRWPPRARS